MDLTKFEAILARLDKDALLVVLKNVRAKGSVEHEDLVLAQLDSRFPSWNISPKTRSGGRTYNRAVFDGNAREFETAKEGYLWLVEKFISRIPKIFENPDQRTARIAIGHGRNYFARSPEKLFRKSPHLRENAVNYHRLSNGWYANTNLDNARKFEVLVRLAFAAGLEYEKIWVWVVLESTDQLAASQERHRSVLELWRSLELELDSDAA